MKKIHSLILIQMKPRAVFFCRATEALVPVEGQAAVQLEQEQVPPRQVQVLTQQEQVLTRQ